MTAPIKFTFNAKESQTLLWNYKKKMLTKRLTAICVFQPWIRVCKPSSFMKPIIRSCCDEYSSSTVRITQFIATISIWWFFFFFTSYPRLIAPKIFNIAIALIKPFLNETTASKIRMLGGNDASSWRKAILEDVDSHQFPAHYGGSLTDPDGNPLCVTKVSRFW